MNQVEDNEKIANHDTEFPPGQLEIKLVEFNGEKRSGDNDHHVFRPTFAEIQSDAFRRKQGRVKKGGVTEKDEFVKGQIRGGFEHGIHHATFRIQVIGNDDV